ncbi:MAG: DUF4956 domain-containing protein [Paludibacteraceae bacterium]
MQFKFTYILFLFLLLTTPSANTFAQENNEESIENANDTAENNNLSVQSNVKLPSVFKAVIKSNKAQKEAEINRSFFINLSVNIVALLLIIGLIYYPNYKRLDTIFTFVLFNVIIFLLTFLLNQVKISMGAAFGLFAVFSMLRYRTAGISVKDMTYLFVFIAMGLLSGIQLAIFELLIVFAVIFLMIFLFDTKLLIKRESTKIIFFEDIELIHADKEQALIEELKNRTGLNIHRISIEEISYLRDSATITIYFYE